MKLHNSEVIFFCNNKNFVKLVFKKQLVLDRVLPRFNILLFPYSILSWKVALKHDSCFIAGRYNKYSRELPQTPWILDGKRIFETSVEDLISSKIKEKLIIDGKYRILKYNFKKYRPKLTHNFVFLNTDLFIFYMKYFFRFKIQFIWARRCGCANAWSREAIFNGNGQSTKSSFDKGRIGWHSIKYQ